MECLWRKEGNTLVPMDEVTEDLLAKTNNGVTVTTSEPRSRRNPKHHRWMMAILKVVIDNSDAWSNCDISDLMLYLKVRCKMLKIVTLPDGNITAVPRSISFASMSQVEFNRVTSRWVYIICSEILPELSEHELLKETEPDDKDFPRQRRARGAGKEEELHQEAAA